MLAHLAAAIAHLQRDGAEADAALWHAECAAVCGDPTYNLAFQQSRLLPPLGEWVHQNVDRLHTLLDVPGTVPDQTVTRFRDALASCTAAYSLADPGPESCDRAAEPWIEGDR